MSNFFDPFNSSDDVEKRSEFSDFLNMPKATKNYIHGCLNAAILALYNHGATEKDVAALVEKTFRDAWKKAESDGVDKNIIKSIKTLQRISDNIQELATEKALKDSLKMKVITRPETFHR